MKISEAIKVLEQDIATPSGAYIKSVTEAKRLGIEALKFFKDWRMGLYLEKTDLLPGETEE